MQRFFLFLTVFVFSFKYGYSFAPPLEREITLSFTNEKVTTVLKSIEEQAEVKFSYTPSILVEEQPISLTIQRKTVREALAMILPQTVFYKSRNNYIILKEREDDNPSKTTEISGYVVDKYTDKKLPNVTLYDKKTLQSVTTNEYGYYTISLLSDEECLTVNKEDYQDTCISLASKAETTLINISIDQVVDSTKGNDTVIIHNFAESVKAIFRKYKGYINAINVDEEFLRNAQVSVIPFVGTNHKMSASVYNKYSFNVIGGYSKGTSVAEVGGVFNINHENMQGVQVAGVLNVVGDSVKGIGIAGILNVTGKYMSGMQGAGVANANFGKAEGVQVAGLTNLNVNGFEGVSLTGVMNANLKSLKGFQLAGVLNITGDTLEGSSVAGVINVSNKSVNSTEIAGMINFAHTGEKNMQITSMANITNKGSSRMQVSAFVNKTNILTGVQIGLINYADSATGVPIGFLSFVRKGLHQLEISSDEVFYANASFRTGVNRFYNIINVGIQPSSQSLWSIGYGLGTSFRLSPKLRSDVTATVNHVSKGGFYFATSELYKFYIGLEYKIGKKIAVAIGPTYNLYQSDMLLPEYANTYSNVAPYHSFESSSSNDFNLKGWWGGKLALRFF